MTAVRCEASRAPPAVEWPGGAGSPPDRPARAGSAQPHLQRVLEHGRLDRCQRGHGRGQLADHRPQDLRSVLYVQCRPRSPGANDESGEAVLR
jgi:hypothetical protein